MQREVIEDAEEYLGKAFPDKQSDAYLLLKFDGNSTKEIEETYDKVAKLCLEQGALDVLISDTQEREDLESQRRFPGGNQGIHDLHG